MATSTHGAIGKVRRFMGFGGFGADTSVHPLQHLTIFSTSLSILGHQTLVRRRPFIAVMPSCAFRTRSRSLTGITNLLPFSKIVSWKHNSDSKIL